MSRNPWRVGDWVAPPKVSAQVAARISKGVRRAVPVVRRYVEEIYEVFASSGYRLGKKPYPGAPRHLKDGSFHLVTPPEVFPIGSEILRKWWADRPWWKIPSRANQEQILAQYPEAKF